MEHNLEACADMKNKLAWLALREGLFLSRAKMASLHLATFKVVSDIALGG